MNKENEKYLVFGFLIVCFLVLFFYSNHVHKKNQEQIKTYKGETIGYATRIKSYKNSRDLIFYFYKDEKRCLSKIDLKDYNNYLTNKFYKVTFDENNPTNNYLYINKPLKPDSITLIKAGFKFTKVYEHDFRTDTYKLRYEWK